jgi:hypothetical protein
VEEWILDRALDPAMREFGATTARMIDPACGSGHFLLGGFARIIEAWRREAPDMPPAAPAHRARDAVAGVDLNPFAVEIARFRMLLAALAAAGETRLAAAPDFRFRLAVGDSLLHGRHFALQGDLAHQTDEGYQRRLRHHFAAEDTSAIEAILGAQYHAVVGNPPYIIPPDPAMRVAYREIYASCHMKYGLGVPFVERFFDLAATGGRNEPAGFVGLIVANSFMKREFGAKLIEEVLPRLDLTHVVDCSGAYIPGHGTPTAILFGRHRPPVASVVRTVRGIRGEPGTPGDPGKGQVWSAILGQTDMAASISDFISTEDTPRDALAAHPWNMGGGGAARVQQRIEDSHPPLSGSVTEIGFGCIISEEDAFIIGGRRDIIAGSLTTRELVIGEEVRDWGLQSAGEVVFPYDEEINLNVSPMIGKALWTWRTVLFARRDYSNMSYREAGRSFGEYHQIPADRNRVPLTIAFGEIATHNHFVLDRGGKVFNRTAPVIKLPARATESQHLGLLGLLNSSTACFWLKQVCHNKGDSTDDLGARTTAQDSCFNTYQFNATRLNSFPVASNAPVDLARTLDNLSQRLAMNLPSTVAEHSIPTRETLSAACQSATSARVAMIALQEELDWRCYRLYGLVADAVENTDAPPLRLGERAFEIVMARRMAAGELETAWFARHGSTPITNLPPHWPADYRSVVERRIALIEEDPTIGLIERPEFKRRWSMDSWEEMEREALRAWLLDRLEDPRFWPATDARLTSVSGLADATRKDADFQSVAALYVGRDAFDLEALVAELATRESAPFLAALRYSESGLRKRADWEETWRLQREEDAIDAELAATRSAVLRRVAATMTDRAEGESETDFAVRVDRALNESTIQEIADSQIAAGAAKRKKERVGVIPVPAKYRRPTLSPPTSGAFAAVSMCRRSGSSPFPIAPATPTGRCRCFGPATTSWRAPRRSRPPLWNARTWRAGRLSA